MCCESQLIDDSPAHPQVQANAQALFQFGLQNVNHDDVDMRQAACYLLGNCCSSARVNLGVAIKPTIVGLMSALQRPKARSEDEGRATDNAVCASMKLVLYCSPAFASQGIDPEPIFKGLLSYIPAKDDMEEAQVLHSILLDLAVSGNVHVVGANNTRLPQVLRFFGEQLDGDNITMVTQRRFCRWCHQLISQMGAGNFEQALVQSGLEAKRQSRLQELMRSL